jgi:hypothetical protein
MLVPAPGRFSNKRLAKPVGQPLTHHSSWHVDPVSGREANDHVQRQRRIGLRLRDARHGWESGLRPRPDAEIAGGEASSVTFLVYGRRSASRN